MLRRVASNISWNWVSLVLGLLISFFLAPFVVNKLGSVYYGIWVIMMQLTGYLYLLDFGVRESVIRFISKHQATGDLSQIEHVVNASLRIYGSISIVCLIISATIAYFFPYVFTISEDAVSSARHVVLITGLNLAQFFLFNVYVGVLMGVQRYDILNKINIFFAAFRVILIVVLLEKGYGIIALAYIQLSINALINMLTFWQSQRILPTKIRFSIEGSAFRSTVKSLINYSFFVLLNNICQKLIFYTDALVIGFFLPASAITYYAIAGNLIEYLRKFIISMASVFNPLTSELEAKDQPEKIQKVLINGTKVSLLFGMPISIVYFFLGENFIDIWMGSEFGAPAASVLTILAVTHLFSLPHHTISSILYGLSKHHIIAYARVFEAVANVALSLILIHKMGIVGVALGTAIPHSISVILILPAIITKILKLKLKDYFLSAYAGPICSSALFAFACYYASNQYKFQSLISFFTVVAALLPLYIIPAWFFSFQSEERKWQMSKILTILKLTPESK